MAICVLRVVATIGQDYISDVYICHGIEQLTAGLLIRWDVILRNENNKWSPSNMLDYGVYSDINVYD